MSDFLVNLLGERLVNSEKAEIDVQALGSKLSVIGLYFGCSLNGPCRQFNASLCEFYSKFKNSSEHKDKLEIVFVSSDQDQKHWQDFLQEMQWPALPFKERHKKMRLWNRYKVTSVPSLVFVEAVTGKVVCRNGLLVVRDDPKGLEFPWGPKPFAEVVAGPLLRSSGQTADSSSLEGSYVGVYFSAHWCPPCRSLTRVLAESYQTVKDSGQKFEIVFVSADRSEDSFKQYFSEMPWVAVPYTDEGRRSRLNRLYGIQATPRSGAERGQCCAPQRGAMLGAVRGRGRGARAGQGADPANRREDHGQIQGHGGGDTATILCGRRGRHERLAARLHQPARGSATAHHPGHVGPSQVRARRGGDHAHGCGAVRG
ncbi:nucleoredoxin-like isoform X4 [Anguilla anguilla]|uniref:nucleoredoxin-like isoform X4 n=1 Tax=Anguilla anguilla TaxID=7936 RepID=UPI0015A99684|nr:nucleoredoxin-like isoform X4 [Anguilla anguilla]